MTNKEVIKFFEKESINSFSFSTELEMKNLINRNFKYLYLILWSEDNIYSWGTMSGKSNRIRKSSILNRKLTGKYDRRVDYLMLKKIYGLKKVYLFEFLDPLIKEKELKRIFTQNHCYHGLNGKNRDEISKSKSIYERFKGTNWFKKIDIDTKNLFDDFFFNVFLGKLKHPENPKRTFYYGDCLEPIIEKILDVNF